MRLRGWLGTALLVPLGTAAVEAMSAAPATSLGGASPWGPATLVLAGAAVAAASLLAWSRDGQRRFATLLVLASAAWFAEQLANPGGTGSVAFTLGLATGGVLPVLVVHAALINPSGRCAGSREVAVVALGYLSTLGVSGLALALVDDPRAQGCAACPRNLLSVTSHASLVQGLARYGLLLSAASLAAAALLLVVRLVRESPAQRRVGGPGRVVALAMALASVVALVHGWSRGYTSNDRVDTAVWEVQAVLLGALSAGVVVLWWRGRRARTAVARLVLELDALPRAAGLREVLRAVLEDPGLELGYLLEEGGCVDAAGSPVVPAVEDGRTSVPLLHRGRSVAVLLTSSDLGADPTLMAEVVAAARLGLHRERLQAIERANLHALRTSRSEAVATADGERRRLERDLHDGAQQRLVVLALSLRLLEPALTCGQEHLEAAGAELRTALAELRELAHGIFPTSLADEGLGSALQALADTRELALDVADVGRIPAEVEAAVYFLVAAVAGRSATAVRLRRSAERVVVAVEVEGQVPDLRDLPDRIEALEGTLAVSRQDAHRSSVLVEVPCAS